MQNNKTHFQHNLALSTKCKKPELGSENHFENYLLQKFFRNLRNHLKQRNIGEADIAFVTNYAKNIINKDNILYIYGNPMQLILQHLANGTIKELYNSKISYKTPYIKNHPKTK